MKKLCPLLKKTVVIHNDLKSDKTAYIGINRFCNNDVVIEEFQPCYEKECMFFSASSKRCMLACHSSVANELIK